MPQSMGLRSSVSGPPSPWSRRGLTAPPPCLDVLTSAGVRTVGWMGVCVVFACRKTNSAFDTGFSGVGAAKWLGPLWSLSGQTRTAPSPYPSGRPPLMPNPPSTLILQVSLPSNNPQAMYAVHLSTITGPHLINPHFHDPGSRL